MKISIRLLCFRWGKSPIDEAEHFGHLQVVEYLRNFQIAQQTEQANQKASEDSNAKIEVETEKNPNPIIPGSSDKPSPFP